MNAGILTQGAASFGMPSGLLGSPTAVPTPFAFSSASLIPRSINDLGVWLDAMDASSFTEVGGQVSEWRDKSGNARNFSQTTANNRPTLFTSASNATTSIPATINGRQGFFFDGANDQLAGNIASLSILSNAPGCTVFIASRWLGAVSNGGSVYTIQSRASFSVFNTATGGVYKNASRDGTSQVGLQNGGTIATGTNYLFRHTVDYEAGTQAVFTNGTRAGGVGTPGGGTGFAVAAAAGSFRIGALNASSNFYPGIIGEVLVYRRALTANETEAVEKGYLAPKWGFTVV